MSLENVGSRKQDKDPPAGGDHLSTYAKLHCQVDTELRAIAYMAGRARLDADAAEAAILTVRTIQADLGDLMGMHTAAVKDLKKKASTAFVEGLEEGQDRVTAMGKDALETLARIEHICQERQSQRLFGTWPFKLFRRGVKEAS